MINEKFFVKFENVVFDFQFIKRIFIIVIDIDGC